MSGISNSTPVVWTAPQGQSDFVDKVDKAPSRNPGVKDQIPEKIGAFTRRAGLESFGSKTMHFGFVEPEWGKITDIMRRSSEQSVVLVKDEHQEAVEENKILRSQQPSNYSHSYLFV
ncbi:hypothetical protein ACO22_03601 [Paracoccidioides brasiliensis]|uniref:Uncharacterized protein n=1 Tax=Paracoccidioides brasiliensis TaxID=121759 RepID=A0A1D2JFE6_PARBR|nr:hypothetical protein ACO22_03601 [Paracoccidioides brasiliensis]